MILDDTKVRNADKIFVLEEGRIQEEGTHAELIAKSGLYFNLVKKQSTSKSMGDLAGVEEESLGTERDDNEVVRKKSGEVATRSSVNTPLSELVVPADVIREIAEREKEEQLQTSLWRVLKINSKVIIIIIIVIINFDETSLWRVLKINSKVFLSFLAFLSFLSFFVFFVFLPVARAQDQLQGVAVHRRGSNLLHRHGRSRPRLRSPLRQRP